MEISEIKALVSLIAVLRKYGLTPDKHDMLVCPFHEDKSPSLKIYAKTNTFHCFGCGATGDQIQFIEMFEKIGKHEAILKAKDFIGVPPLPGSKSKPGKPAFPAGRPEPPEEIQTPEERTAILARIFESFKNGLSHPVSVKPKEYLKSRNLNAELLEIGYNSGQFHHHGKLPEKDQQACIKAGLLIPYNGSVPNATGTAYTPFAKDCIIFPLKNKSGNIVSLYGRSITNNDKSKHYYLKDRQGLYPGYPRPETTRLILTEAIIDAATLLQLSEISSQYEILSCYGTNGLTREHREAIKRLQRLEEIIFFFDGDNAGRDAIKKYQEELLNELPDVKLSTVETPENEDINSLLQGHDTEIFTYLLDNRKLFSLTEIVLAEPASAEAPADRKEATPEPLPACLPEQSEGMESARTRGKLNTRNPEYITYTTDDPEGAGQDLQIVILGGINLGQLDRLRITLKISRTDPADGGTGYRDPLHSIRHTLDLYHSDYLEKFIGKASEQLEISTTVIKRAIAELTEQIEAWRLSKIESMKEQKPQVRQISEERKNRAIRYLKAPNLMQRTGDDIGKTGVVGEEINRLLMYLVFTSRLREQPLHIVSLGASGTGYVKLMIM